MLVLQTTETPARLAVVRTLFREYAESLGHDLCFQGFEEELRDLPGDYAPPKGMLLVAADGPSFLGCVAVRPLDSETAELKRLYVRPAARARGIGRSLAVAAIDHAWGAGFRRIRLDTLPEMREAQALYRSLGFLEIAPYRPNPVPGTAYLELQLQR